MAFNSTNFEKVSMAIMICLLLEVVCARLVSQTWDHDDDDDADDGANEAAWQRRVVVFGRC